LALIRPELQRHLARSREAIAAALVGVFGLWLIWLGGYLLLAVGAAILAFAVSWMVAAVRRLRFAQDTIAPGVVEVDEGQVGYMGPRFGGYVALPDLVELRLVTMQGRRLWRLKQLDGQTLLIPVDAAGAERLFDAFGSLPGMDMAALVAAVQTPQVAGQGGLPALRDQIDAKSSAMHLIWRRQAAIGRI
jgi:hypothetical protein